MHKISQSIRIKWPVQSFSTPTRQNLADIVDIADVADIADITVGIYRLSTPPTI